jgi:hypothetical protein
MRIYDSDKLVRNFVPCVNKYGILGLFEVVHNIFYSNAGSGEFLSDYVGDALPVEKGGTGATDVATARTNLGAVSTAEMNAAIAAIPTPDVSGQINAHDNNENAHQKIRELITKLSIRLNTVADSDEITLDQMSELVAYIRANRTVIEEITTKKVNVSDIINDLMSTDINKPLSAAQGRELKTLIDAIVVPTKTSELANDSGFITKYAPIAIQDKVSIQYDAENECLNFVFI